MGLFNKLFGAPTPSKNSGQSRPASAPAFKMPRRSREDVEKQLMELSNQALNRLFDTKPEVFDYDYITDPSSDRYPEWYHLPISELQKKAEAGDHVAEFVYADYFADKEDFASAKGWAKRSADGGVPDGEWLYGVIAQMEENFAEAETYLTRACSHGMLLYAGKYLLDLTSRNVGSSRMDGEQLKRSLFWWSLFCDVSSEGEDYYVSASAVYNLHIAVDETAMFTMGSEHLVNGTDDFSKWCRKSYAEREDMALIAWRWGFLASEEERKTCGLDLAGPLRAIGEAALELNRDYALDVLLLAADLGNDYAVACMTRPLIDKRIQLGEPIEQFHRDGELASYRRRIERFIQTSNDNRQKAHALLAMANYQIIGAGCAPDDTAAYYSTKQAADMKYGLAQHMLKTYVRNPDGSYRVHN